jgi:1,4-dihydroxy-2-naphthoate octaprenyltransferase
MTTTDLTTQNTPSKFELWLAAIKPPMYSVAIVPILLGTAIAYHDTGSYDRQILTTFVISAILILAWLNLSNDVFDADTGIDRNKVESIVNLTGKKNLIFWMSNLLLIVAFFGMAAISSWQQDPTVMILVLLCCALGYSYQGPPFRFGYLGLGEIICFVTFGPLAIAAAYYSQTKTFADGAIAASIFIGITTSIILFCSHFHQVEDDLAAGKLSPIVRLGTVKGARVLTGAVISVFILVVVFVSLGLFPLPTFLTFVSLPFAWQLIDLVSKNHDRPELVRTSKYIAVRLHFASGLLLIIGYLL